MADKSFGVKELNLISASGTPTITSPNSVNINATNVAISTDITVGGMVSLGAGTSISSPGTNVLTFGTNSVERVRILSDGKVGIGTDMGGSPASFYGFGVYRSTGTGYLYTETAQSGGSAGLRAKAGTADFTIYTTQGTGQLAVHDNTNNVDRLKIDSSGKLKLGSNTLVTPNANADNFVIDTGDVDSGISILSATTGRIYFGDAASTDQGSIRYVHTDDSMRFETNSGERLRIAANGDIGIANDSPTNWGGGVPTIEIKGTASTGSNRTRSGAIAFESGSGNDGYAALWGQNGGIHIYTGATDRASTTYAAQFNSSGNLAFASGNGIDFSATANSSGSIGSEVFDDYEEGTWSPQVTQGVSGTATYSQQYGWYTKIGRIVTLYFYLRFASSGNTGSNSIFRVGNFPFQVASNYQNTYNRGMGVSNFHSIPGFTSANISFYGAGASNTYASTYQGSTAVATSSSVNSQYIIGGFEYVSE